MKKFFENVKKWLSGSKAEVKKVIWPTPAKLLKNAGLSVATMIVTAAVLFGFDTVSQLFVKAVLMITG